MKEFLVFCTIVFCCLSNSACLRDEPAVARNVNSTAISAASPEMTPTAQRQTNKTIASASNSPADKKQVSGQADTTINLAQLQNDIANHLGDLLIVSSYKPSTLQVDFDGDNLADVAVVVGAKDRFGDENKIGDMFSGLAYTSEGLTFQNLRSGGTLFAKPRLSGTDIEKNKAKLKPKSNLGLLVVLSGGQGWKDAIEQKTYDKRFLLLDAVFEADFEDKQNAPDMLSLVKKGDECLPKTAKGEGIFSGDRESGGKVIYFNGRSFAWTQCGD